MYNNWNFHFIGGVFPYNRLCLFPMSSSNKLYSPATDLSLNVVFQIKIIKMLKGNIF